MIDLEALQIPLTAQKALLVSDSDWGLDELAGLLTTMGGEPTERLRLPPNRQIPAVIYVGSGKLKKINRIMKAKKLDFFLVDFDLPPPQQKKIKKVVKNLILDRSGIFLKIFNRHART